MSEATELLAAIGSGDPDAAAQLWPLVYHELRQTARAQMARERAGHTLQATALVHEAYVRLLKGQPRRRTANCRIRQQTCLTLPRPRKGYDQKAAQWQSKVAKPPPATTHF